MARLHRPIHFAPTLTQIILITICVASGLLLSAQWQSQPARVVNPLQPYTSLTETRDALTSEQQKLKAEIDQLNQSLDQRSKALADSQHLDSQLVSTTDQASLIAGLTNVRGKGIVVTLDDSKVGSVSDQAIAHAADLRDVVSLLRAAKAEAISINDERVINTTSIDCIVNTILVNQTRLTNPFIIKAVGDPNLMSQVMGDPSVLQDLHRRVITDGVVFNVESKNQLDIAAYRGLLPSLPSSTTSTL